MKPSSRRGKSSQPAKRTRARKPLSSLTKLSDVARMADVSLATASRAINSPALVSDDTRARVQAAIKSLGWIPHGAAKTLASVRTRTIGALIPTLGHQTIAGMLESLQNSLGTAGYTLLLGRPDSSAERTIQQASKMIEHGVECLVLMGEDQPQGLMEMIEQRNLFYVVAYTSGRQGLQNCIGFDNYLEMERLTRHLLDLGHRDFGLLTRAYEANDRIRQRVEAVHQTLAQIGVAVRPQHQVIVPNWGIEAGRDGMRQILSDATPPTAVICANDYLATGALLEAKARGLHVPDDVSISGFDDLELVSLLDPPLTTVHVPNQQIGEEIARFIINRLDKGEAVLPKRFEATLMVRGSTGRPRTSR